MEHTPVKRILAALDRLEAWLAWLASLSRRHLCGVCAHIQGSHNYDPALDEHYCSKCRIGEDVHAFEELEGRTR